MDLFRRSRTEKVQERRRMKFVPGACGLRGAGRCRFGCPGASVALKE